MHAFDSIQGHTLYASPLGRQSVILDLGANHGNFAGEMSARYGGSYHLVEANPVLAEALRVRARFPVWHCAVAGTEGLVQFNIAECDEGSSLLTLPSVSAFNCVRRDTVQVQARTLESLLAEITPSHIDLIKMDIEGAEIEVLRSLPDATLRRVGQFTVEFHSDPAFGFDMERDVEETLQHMQQRGFLCLDFSDRTRRDVLFINLAVHPIARLQRLKWELRLNPPAWLYATWMKLPPRMKTGVSRLAERASALKDSLVAQRR